MKRRWAQVIAFISISFITGFTIGFFCGEKVYTWLIRPFHNANGEFDLLIFWTGIVGVGTLALASIAFWQNKKANDIAEKTLQVQLRQAENENRRYEIEVARLKDKNVINVEIEDAKYNYSGTNCREVGGAENYENLNDCLNASYIDCFHFTLRNKDNTITRVKILNSGATIAEKETTIVPNTNRSFRINLKNHNKQDMVFYLYLKGDTGLETVYEMKLYISPQNKNIKLLEHIKLSNR
jgi:hypothetical protein